MAAEDLVSLSEAREYLQKEAGKTGQDAVIGNIITRASRAILGEVEREFAPLTTDATRTLRYRPNRLGLLDLVPYDLRTVTTLKLNPEDASPQTLVANVDYALEPIGAPDGVFSRVRLSQDLSVASNFSRRFGYSQVEIRGAWGFASVPPDVKQWCLVTIWTWMRRDVQSFSASFNIDEQRLERPEALPLAAVRGLDRWRRAPFA